MGAGPRRRGVHPPTGGTPTPVNPWVVTLITASILLFLGIILWGLLLFDEVLHAW